jgi:tRNA threonylcarbamoyladenosine biosynthesis protein TsaE
MKTEKSLGPSELKKFAETLAKRYQNRDATIGLVGPLGAGKTTFTKHFAACFGIKKIKSPTFIVGSRYPTGKQLFYHYDFYRLSDIKQLIPLEFSEILSSKNRIVLIEWVDKFPELAAKCDLIITFKITGKNLRDVTIK